MRLSRIAYPLAALALAVTFLGPAATASRAPRAPGMPVSSAPRYQDPADVAEYWTPERMANATPVDAIAVEGYPQLEPPATETRGEPTYIDPIAPRGWRQRTEATTTSSTSASQPIAFTREEILDTTIFPYRTHGKVFFTEAISGSNAVCSGTVVGSENKSVVFTAGHCVHGGAGKTWHTNWMFVPGYRDGVAPYGQWFPLPGQLWALDGFTVDSNANYDAGAAVIARDAAGNSIANVVGSRGIAFNLPRGQIYRAYGHPADPSLGFNGERMFRCNSTHSRDDAVKPGPPSMGIGCDMGPGSSGGGWVIGDDIVDGNEYVNSVMSYAYANATDKIVDDVMYGPYFGPEVEGLYNIVRFIGQCPGLESVPGNHIVGTTGPDRIVGTSGADVVCTFEADDQIVTGGGNDIVIAGQGPDRVDGGPGADDITGNAGGDSLFGGPGGDTLTGAGGRDLLDGGPGRDNCVDSPRNAFISC